jgi:hypothetical protein
MWCGRSHGRERSRPNTCFARRSISGHEDREIRAVLSEDPIPWRVASGRASGLICAEQLFDVYATHRYRKAPFRAFLAPPEVRPIKDSVRLNAQ